MPAVASPKRLPGSPEASEGLQSSAVTEAKQAAEDPTEQTLLEEPGETCPSPDPCGPANGKEEEDTIPAFFEEEIAGKQVSAPATPVEIAKAATQAHPPALVPTLPAKAAEIAKAATQAHPPPLVPTFPAMAPAIAKAATQAHPPPLVPTFPAKAAEIAKAATQAHPPLLVPTFPAKAPAIAKAATQAHPAGLAETLAAKSPRIAMAATQAHFMAPAAATPAHPKASVGTLQMAAPATQAHSMALAAAATGSTQNPCSKVPGDSNSSYPSSPHETAAPPTNMVIPGREEREASRIAVLERQLQALRQSQQQSTQEPVDTPTPAAIDRRLRRLMKPNAEGVHRISEEVRNLWSSKSTKDQVLRMFQECSYSPD